jgi:hypothetical protein
MPHSKLLSRENVDLMSMTMSHRFDILDQRTQQIITSMLADRTVFEVEISNKLRDQTLALTQLVSRIEQAVPRGNLEAQPPIAALGDDNQRRSPLTQGLSRTHSSDIPLPDNEATFRAAADKSVLASLRFLTMATRYEEVIDAYPETFKWIFSETKQQRWSSFGEWLREGEGIYWISGKAGSGKSTLMRHIYNSPLTMELLATWAAEIPLCMSSFFFWRSGTPEQRSQTGLLRTLLFDVLSQQPKLISQILPWHWAKGYSGSVSYSDKPIDYSWSLPTLMKAFAALVQQTTIPLRLCLFIDGLDEFDQVGCSHETMAALLREITKSGDIKVCLSSRPLVAFSNVFEGSPSLRLQDLTRDDINYFVADKLHKNARFKFLASEETSPASKLVLEIVEKADGVFLWVSIVVKSLLEGLQYRDSISDLQKRLRLLPSDLEALYSHMFGQIELIYKESAAEIFQIVRAARDHRVWVGHQNDGPPLTNIALSLATNKDLKNEGLSHLSEHHIRAMSQDMEIQVRVRCAGLLECTGSEQPEDPRSRVGYLHATARDFIEDNANIWNGICSRTKGSGFDPHAAMLKACVFELELIPRFGSQFWTETLFNLFSRESLWESAMIYAFYTNKATNSLDLSLIERLQTRVPFYDEFKFLHGLPFIRQATYYGLFAYVEDFIRSRRKITKIELSYLLYWALSPFTYTLRYPCSFKLVSMLLKRGADANTRLKVEDLLTPWEGALRFSWSAGRDGDERFISQNPFAREWIAILKHLVLSGADPKASIDFSGSQLSALVITHTFEESWPSETAELVELLKARGARLEVSKGQRVGRYLKQVASRIDWRDEVPAEWSKKPWGLD